MAMCLHASRQRSLLAHISVRAWVDSKARKRLDVFRQLKDQLFSSGIEPATFWPVAHNLKQLKTFPLT
jgi:hypothetical protein